MLDPGAGESGIVLDPGVGETEDRRLGLPENTVFSDLGSVPGRSLVTVLVTVGVVDLHRLHRSRNTDVVILLFPTFVVTLVFLSSETSEAGTSEWVPSTEG